MIDDTIEDLIRSSIPLTHGKTSQGWEKVFCEVCGDGSRTKGPRGGWILEGNRAIYHCFNCGISGSFDSDREYAYSKNMRAILSAFKIPEDQHKKIANKKFFSKESPISKKQSISNEINYIEIPSHFYKLCDAKNDDVIAEKAKSYLLSRKINPESYDFYLSSGIVNSGNPREEAIAKSLRNRLIIPAYKNGKMIYWQARLLDTSKKEEKYLSPQLPKSKVIYGYDRLFTDSDKPLFITEGFFDSHLLNGIAVLGNELSKFQIDLINKSNRRKIVVPDRKINKSKTDNGKKLASQALSLGWEISLPDFGECTDVNSAIIKYGKIYVMNSINQKISSGFLAKISLDMW